MWHLKADFNRCSQDPHILHEPSGIKVKIQWVQDLPHIKKNEMEELRQAHVLSIIEPKRLRAKYGARMAVYLTEKFKDTKNESLKQYAANRVSELELLAHKRNGHIPFMKECPDCRAGAIKQRAHRRVSDGGLPGGELSIDISGRMCLAGSPRTTPSSTPGVPST